MASGRFLAVLILALFGCNLDFLLSQASQDGIIELTLTAAGTAVPIPGALITLEGPLVAGSSAKTIKTPWGSIQRPVGYQNTATADKDGRATFRNLSPGQYSVSAQKDGYSQRGAFIPIVVQLGHSPQKISIALIRDAGVLALLPIMTTSPQASAQTGSQILFEGGQGTQWGIFVMDADGRNQTQLDIRTGVGIAPTWSRDGCRIVFWHETRSTDNKLIRTGIYVMNANGSNQKPLIDNVNAGMEQDLRSYFSPDGSRIVFVSSEKSYNDIRVIDSDGSGAKTLTGGTAGIYPFYPSWSPDGSHILFGSNGRPPKIRVMNSDGTNLQDIGGGQSPARWSPDGSRIAFVSAEQDHSNIVVMNSDGTNVKVLTGGTGRSLRPSWSPDGSRIAFQTVSDDDIFLEVVNVDGTHRAKLASNLLFEMDRAVEPSWSPDGSRIVFTRMPFPVSEIAKRGMASLSFDIYTVGVDGSDIKKLTTTGRALHPTWSPISKCQGNR
jgi:TolB protein